MAPSLQELIDFLLNEVALCGSQGVYSSNPPDPLYSARCIRCLISHRPVEHASLTLVYIRPSRRKCSDSLCLVPFLFFYWRHISAVLNWQLYAQPTHREPDTQLTCI